MYKLTIRLGLRISTYYNREIKQIKHFDTMFFLPLLIMLDKINNTG